MERKTYMVMWKEVVHYRSEVEAMSHKEAIEKTKVFGDAPDYFETRKVYGWQSVLREDLK